MEGLFDSLHLPGNKKLRIENNDFTLKHKIRLKMLSKLYVSDPKWEKMLYALFTETFKLNKVNVGQLKNLDWEHFSEKR